MLRGKLKIKLSGSYLDNAPDGPSYFMLVVTRWN